MKKTINISIGGMSFQVEEDAYSRLETYLAEVRSHFSQMEGADEIVSDIEARLAEQFEARVGKGGILAKEVVEEMIKIMGEPSEFEEGAAKTGADNQQSSGKQSSFSGKRLMRNGDDVIIAGVASGVAAYIGIDAIWVRLVFALSIFFGGFGIVLYIILWIIMPEAKTKTEKMQMRGQPINLKNIEETVKERVEEFKKKDHSGVKRAAVAPFRAIGRSGGVIGRVIKGFIFMIFRIVGFALTVAGALAVAALVVAAVSLLFNLNSPYVDFPLAGIISGAVFYAGVTAAFFVAFVPVMFLILLGTTLLAGKSTFSKMGSVGLLAVWILAIAISVNIGFRYAPQIESAYKNGPGQEAVARELELKDFSRVKLESAYRATVHQSDEYKVVATGRQRDLDKMAANVNGGELTVRRGSDFRMCLFCWNDLVNLDIYMPEITDADLSGASRISLSDSFEAENFTVKLSGASRAVLHIVVNKLDAQLSGASNLEIIGEAGETSVKASGASEFSARDAEVDSAVVDLSGASKARFSSLDSLIGEASGASKIYYTFVSQKDVDLSGASKEVQESH